MKKDYPSDYYPLGFKFIKITTPKETLVKLFSCFGDSWRINSGCVSIVSTEDLWYDVSGYSGSTYSISQDDEGRLSGYCYQTFEYLLKKESKGEVEDFKIEEISLAEAIVLVNKTNEEN